MLNYWFKLKNTIYSLLIFFVTNAYLIYVLTKYVSDPITGSLIIFITNELFIFIGVLFYLIYDLKLKTKDRLNEIEYLVKRRGIIK